MASIILSSIGASAFGSIGGFVGSLVGSSIDGYLSSELGGRVRAVSKLGTLSVQSSIDGAPLPIIYGRAKISGQIIWASKFKETNIKRKIGGKSGQKITENKYFISFAIALCEGEISGLGKVWVNGDEFDLNNTEYRLYRGTPFQDKDPLIEAIEGIKNTPRYNDIAYIVFEDFDLDNYGDRIPQFAFEVFCPPKSSQNRLEDLIKGVCLIPGAGEFAYATTSIRHLVEPGHDDGVNNNQSGNKTDFLVALDNLERDLPQVKNISLVVAWFGTDLNAENCEIKPKIDRKDKVTSPYQWAVAGLGRESADIISNYNGNVAYGGTPCDTSVLEAIKEIKSRGLKITFNPFIMMDCAGYPWRGRISVGGDNTSAARSKINEFYNGKTWSYRNFILHYANLCAAAGGVDTFLLGSEMVGLSHIRDAQDKFSFVENLIALASEVRAILPNAKISYGADWTEYGAYYADNNTYFPLDSLWANDNIDFIGIDYYAPISDRHASDASYSIADFQNHIEGGEAYDYYYQNLDDRNNKIQTPIIDTIYHEEWTYRQKDLRGFWSNPHYERVLGVKKPNPTPWIAQSKPIKLLELGYAAIDRAGNQPSAFPDAKSIENSIPYFSTGTRDDMEQRNCLSAFLSYWSGNKNPQSNHYAGKMIDMDGVYIWAWDARPYPAFPALSDIWADSDNMPKGHWLMGRMGQGNLAEIIKDIALRAGIENINTSGVLGIIDGFIIENPQDARTSLENLIYAFGIEVNQSGDIIFFKTRQRNEELKIISPDDLILDDAQNTVQKSKEFADKISRFQFSCYASDVDYDIISHEVVGDAALGKRGQFSLPIIAGREVRDEIARYLLALTQNGVETAQIRVGIDAALMLEIGDNISLDGEIWRVERIENDVFTTLYLSKAFCDGIAPNKGELLNKSVPTTIYSRLFGVILSLPYPFIAANDCNAKVFVAQSPFFGAVELKFNGLSLVTLNKSANYGYLNGNLAQSKISQKLNCEIQIYMAIGELPNSGYLAFIENDIVKDIIYFANAALISSKTYKLTGVVRGLSGVAEAPEIADGTFALLLDDAGIEVHLDGQYLGIDMDYQFTTSGFADETGYIKNYIFENSGQKQFAPCHLSAMRKSDGVHIGFIRRAAGNGDGWEATEVPANINEKYIIEILSGNVTISNMVVNTNEFIYTNAMELNDFGQTMPNINFRVAQIDDKNIIGNYASAIIAL